VSDSHIPVSRLDSSGLSMIGDWGNGPSTKSLAATLTPPRKVGHLNIHVMRDGSGRSVVQMAKAD
jgi:hypothetical protein